MPARRELAVAMDGSVSAPTGLSPTSASTWRQCELKFSLTYALGWTEGGTVPQLIGNTAHRAIELLYGLEPAERTRARASELLEVAYAEESAKSGVANLVENVRTLGEQVLTACHDALDGLFELENPQHITVGPEGLEVWVSASLYDTPVRGRIDRLYDASGAYVVADYKSGRTLQVGPHASTGAQPQGVLRPLDVRRGASRERPRQGPSRPVGAAISHRPGPAHPPGPPRRRPAARTRARGHLASSTRGSRARPGDRAHRAAVRLVCVRKRVPGQDSLGAAFCRRGRACCVVN